MSDKIRKFKERASRLAAKGKLAEALDEYQKCVKLEPRDLSVRQKLAETFARLGRREDAIREYQGVAGSYAADGLLLKAIAINKVILTLDPTHTETQTALADLYTAKRGDLSPIAVQMPKAMSAALGGKRSASDIRGTPAKAVGASTPPAAIPVDDDVVEIDADSGIEVLSVESAMPPLALGVPLQTRLSDIIAVSQGHTPGPMQVDPGFDIDFDDDEPELVVGDELPADEEVLDDDDGEIFELAESAEISTDSLPEIPLFSELPKSAFIALTERMNLHQAEAGEILIAEGEYASSMYIVIQGRVKVVREMPGGEELKLAELTDGSFFGEMALLSSAPRTASVIAIEETMLFEISRDLVEEITSEHASVDDVMRRFHRNRLLTNLLKTSPIFQPFSAVDKKALIEKFKSRNVESGKTLITHDKPGDGLYVLLSGRCEVTRADLKGRDVVLAELKDGDVFGEMSALWKTAASASVRTVTPCIVLRLPRKDFDELIMTHPQVLEALSSLSSEREQFNQDLLGSSDDVIADFLV